MSIKKAGHEALSSAVCLQALLTAASMTSQQELKDIGLDDETIQLLRNIRVTDIAIDGTSRYAGNLVEVRFRTHNLKTYLRSRLSHRLLEETIDKAIRLGINHVQLYEATGISREEFQDRRMQLGVAPVPRGRVESLSIEEESALYRIWKELNQQDALKADKLGRYVAIAEEASLPLNRIWKTIGEFEGQEL